MPPGLALEIKSNLLLAEKGLDMTYVGGNPTILDTWRVSQNWRQVRIAAQTAPDARGWIRFGEDTILEQIEILSAQAGNVDFLRPPKGSTLGTAGAGGDLPEYVGAVPPEGVDPWDWDITWQARASKTENTEPKANESKRESGNDNQP